jgi:hypothetical protein
VVPAPASENDRAVAGSKATAQSAHGTGTARFGDVFNSAQTLPLKGRKLPHGGGLTVSVLELSGR